MPSLFMFIYFYYRSPVTELIHNKLIVDQDPAEICLFVVFTYDCQALFSPFLILYSCFSVPTFMSLCSLPLNFITIYKGRGSD